MNEAISKAAEELVALHPELRHVVDQAMFSRCMESGLAGIQRWNQYQDPSRPFPARAQTTIQHVGSISIGATMMVFKLVRPSDVDIGMILSAFPHHDYAEVIHFESGKDVLHHNKTIQNDIAEFEYMCQWYRRLYPDESVRQYYEDVFLLQFAGAKRHGWPEPYRTRLNMIAERYPLEVLLFEIIEHWDYFLYAMEQLFVNDNPEVVSEVVYRNGKRLDQLSVLLPTFGEFYWTPALSEWAWNHLQHQPFRNKT